MHRQLLCTAYILSVAGFVAGVAVAGFVAGVAGSVAAIDLV